MSYVKHSIALARSCEKCLKPIMDIHSLQEGGEQQKRQTRLAKEKWAQLITNSGNLSKKDIYTQKQYLLQAQKRMFLSSH